MRRATVEDVPRILDMMERFHASEACAWPWDRQGAEDFLLAVLGAHFVALTDRGFIVGVIQRHPLSPAWVYAAELFWWSEDGSGVRLMRAFQDWAVASGAKEIRYSCPEHNEPVKKFFARQAAPIEAVFSEVI